MFWMQKPSLCRAVLMAAVLMAAAAALPLAACGNRAQPEATAAPGDGTAAARAAAADGAAAERSIPYRITATTGMVADLVGQVAGDRASVDAIIGEGVDPHLYVPTRSDVAALLEADVVFYSGLLLEGKMTDTLIKVAGSRPVHAVTELVDESLLLQPAEFAGHFDPHLWMDVSGWMQAVRAVTEALTAFDPAGADGYRRRAAAYTATLEALHQYALRALGSIPAPQRMLVTAHDAFNYFGRAYGLEVAGIQGISTESEAGLDRINRLVDLLVTRRVGAVFAESTIADRNVRALIEGAAARGHRVVVGGELFSDAMGQPGTYRGTYVGMLDHNVTTVARALGGDVPDRGFQGLLTPAAPAPSPSP